MIEPTRILAIRHGETSWNVDTRIQGQLDIPLNEAGHAQAARMAQALVGEPVAAVYSSDLSRAWETAHYLGRAVGVAVSADPALRERAFGEFEGRTFAQIETALPEQARRWRKRDPHFTPLGGESLSTLRDRVVAAAERLAARHAGELIALVSHGGVMDVLYRAATQLDIGAPRTWVLANTAINRMLWSPDGFSLVGWGDVRHLDEATLDDGLTPGRTQHKPGATPTFP